MATRDDRCGGGPDGPGEPVTLPDVVPFDLTHLTRLSWELGSRTVEGEDASLVGDWSARDRQWEIAVFDVTSETVVLRARTPVGRERFYGAIRSEMRSATRALDADAAWRSTESESSRG
ncbi:hypothetical protein C471_05149 [Halorubrum saccharovorum DSM 1137]|uniref:Uncharacterized protein n=1 Tax=Halorubrum saccharovorum DSM 1137 TaxID=1227484 RepID=M0E2J5_9EURY|nr:hypothetical protein [Halorubrum saccharovorum]ELZ42005.1 hypothetical protein C471_05149 [Halorubrum saccharovorum DSM 1137]